MRQALLFLLSLFMAVSSFVVEGLHIRTLEDGDDHDSSNSGSDHEGSTNDPKSSSFFDHTAVVIVVGVVAVVLVIAAVMLEVARRRRNRAMERNSSPQADELSPAPPVGVAYARQ
ncbi:hypothetical protein PF011_g8210 [Phytophthora fragariae]|uniref:RxLR effector protein n=1 Tax=Phytophthora fragariae TaxID=53985 RepID=A0A6A3L7W7_9STRA|nr:hypothetical protein PF011_g8210 [Phytophthora fragariae]